jgi:hypothetical protein
MIRSRLRAPSAAMVIAFIALFVALSGTAVAVAPTVVNIADPTAPTRVAGVDSTGRLKTVSTQGAPARPFSVYKELFDITAVVNNVVIPATGATVAVSRIDISPWSGSNLRRFVYLEQYAVPAGGSCDSPLSFRIVGVYEVGPGTVSIDEPGTPMILKPLPGAAQYCLIAQSYPNAATDSTFQYFVASGFVVSGTLPSGVATTSAGARPQSGGRKQPSAPEGITSP